MCIDTFFLTNLVSKLNSHNRRIDTIQIGVKKWWYADKLFFTIIVRLTLYNIINWETSFYLGQDFIIVTHREMLLVFLHPIHGPLISSEKLKGPVMDDNSSPDKHVSGSIRAILHIWILWSWLTRQVFSALDARIAARRFIDGNGIIRKVVLLNYYTLDVV